MSPRCSCGTGWAPPTYCAGGLPKSHTNHIIFVSRRAETLTLGIRGHSWYGRICSKMWPCIIHFAFKRAGCFWVHCKEKKKKTVKLLVIREKTAIKRYFITDAVKKLYFKRSYMSFYCKYCEKRTINNLIIHGEHVFLARQCIFKW